MRTPEDHALSLVARLQQDQLGGRGFRPFAAELRGLDPTDVVNGGIAPWIQPPQGHIPFLEAGVLAAPGVGAAGVVLTMPVPSGMDGVINGISNNYVAGGFVSGSGQLVWRILADGRAIRNFNNIIVEFGTLQIPRVVDGIRVFSDQTITYTIDHIANAALGGNVVCTLKGYFYPRTVE